MKKTSIVLASITTFFVAIYFFIYIQKIRHYETYIQSLEETLSLKNEIIDKVNSFILTTAKDENKRLNINELSSLEYEKLSNYNKPLCSLPLLVVRLSEGQCSDCVRNLLNILQEKIPQALEKRVVILTDFSRYFYAKKFVEENPDIPFAFRNMKRTKAVLKSDFYNAPYIFVIDNDSKINNVLIHLTDEPERTKQYIVAMISKFLLEAESK